jgi:hypothetical protein
VPTELMVKMKHHELHSFHCEPCHYEWQVKYEVRDLTGSRGSGPQYFYLTGIPASPPGEGRRCPNCWVATIDSQMVDGDLALKR